MCLAAIAHRIHPQFRLIVLANRDEFHARPALSAHLWTDQPDVLGGRDARAGGTWLAIDRHRRLGLVTNYREPAKVPADAPTRGRLVPAFLAGEQSPGRFLAGLAAEAADYAGFNLLLADRDALWYASNRHPAFSLNLPRGVHALSNHLLDTPWPKLRRLRERLTDWLETAPPQLDTVDSNLDPLWAALANDERADSATLPATGISPEWELLLSSAFIRHADYGTRCSTLVLVGHDDSLQIEERSFATDGSLRERARWQAAPGVWPPAPAPV
jgi:uncharacterized protein with NRDE domain